MSLGGGLSCRKQDAELEDHNLVVGCSALASIDFFLARLLILSLVLTNID
jgi:hypothetical protein